jgi:hypothetical protein
VAKTVTDISVNKRNKKGGSKGRLPHRSCLTRRVQDAQKQTNVHRPNENATHRAWLDNADTSAAYDASCGKGNEDAATETTAHKD